MHYALTNESCTYCLLLFLICRFRLVPVRTVSSRIFTMSMKDKGLWCLVTQIVSVSIIFSLIYTSQ